MIEIVLAYDQKYVRGHNFSSAQTPRQNAPEIARPSDTTTDHPDYYVTREASSRIGRFYIRTFIQPSNPLICRA